jgi:hypothetical protein
VSNILADTYTASAEDAEVVIAVEEWVILFDRKSPIGDGIGDLAQFQIVHQFRQVTLAVVGTVLASRGHGCFTDCGLEIITIASAFAHQTGVWMLG